MKKLFPAIACLLFTFAISRAEVVSFNFTDSDAVQQMLGDTLFDETFGTTLDNIMLVNGAVTIDFTKGTIAYPTIRKATNGLIILNISNGSVMTISTDKTINEINFYFNQNRAGIEGDNNYISGKWTGKAKSVSFTGVNTTEIMQIDITYSEDEIDNTELSNPTISCEKNIVSITCANKNADIYYTIDGRNPSVSSSKYTAPFPITQNTTVKAIAVLNDQQSGVVTFSAKYVVVGKIAFIASVASNAYPGNATNKINIEPPTYIEEVKANVAEAEDPEICNLVINNCSYSNGNKYYNWRKEGYLSVTPQEGITITKISWNDLNDAQPSSVFNIEQGGGTITKTGTGNDNSGNWSGTSNGSIKLTSSVPVGISYIEVEYTTAPEEVEVPIKWNWNDNGEDVEIDGNTHQGTHHVGHTYSIGAVDGVNLAEVLDIAVWKEKKATNAEAEINAVAENDNYQDAIQHQDYEIGTDNGLQVKLLKVGKYQLIPSVKEGVTGYTVDSTPLEVTISPLTITPNLATTRVAFNPEGTNVMPILSFDTDLEYGKDFTIKVTPVSEGWATASDPSKLQASYTEAFGAYAEYLLAQIASLSTDESSPYSQRVDGFYSEFTEEDITAGIGNNTPDSNEHYNYNVSVLFPCSGVYTLEILPTENTQINTAATTTVTVYPNLEGKFGKDWGFNIEGYTFAGTESASDVMEIDIPEDIIQKWNGTEGNPALNKVSAFIPGTYFVSEFKDPNYGASGGNSGNTIQMKRMADANVANYFTYLDLSALSATEGSSTTANVQVAKNGASKDYSFTVKVGGDGNNVSTGVSTVGAEEDRVEYYNLNGVKVNPDRMGRGLYIRVANGKAEKVVYTGSK